MTEKELKIIADRFGSICDYGPSDEEIIESSDWCEEHCGKVEDWECWKKWIEIKIGEAE